MNPFLMPTLHQSTLKSLSIAAVFLFFVCLSSCSSRPNESALSNSKVPVSVDSSAISASSESDEQLKAGKGIGPVRSVELGPIDDTKAQIGKELFEAKCTTCHNYSTEKKIGPGLLGITEIRKPEWIENQMLNPAEMEQKDSIGEELLSTYLTQMTDQKLTLAEARNILEYFRQQDALNNK